MRKIYPFALVVIFVLLVGGPLALAYQNEAPVDPYEMRKEWICPGPAHCGFVSVLEFGGQYIYFCFVSNPDKAAEWQNGIYGVGLDESGRVTDKILIFSIANKQRELRTYILINDKFVLDSIKNLDDHKK